MASANAKIKQAGMSFSFCHTVEMICICKGQVYEKKSKKGTRDVTDEHTRYVNLISTLGPEMSQEK
jgi:hypothetical protein